MANIINVCAPLILIPYVTSRLGAQKYGEYSYYESITQYLALVVALSTLVYGAREIGFVKSDVAKRTKVFCDIIFLRLLLLCLVFLSFLISYNLGIKYSPEFYVFQILLFSTSIDSTFFFQGIGDFKKLAFRTFFLKTLNIALVLILVTNSDHLFRFIAITTITSLATNLWLLFESFKYLDKSKIQFNFQSIQNRILGISKLLVMQASITVSLYLGKLLLGVMTSIENVAYFDIAFKFIILTQLVTSSISAVVMPKISELISNDKKKDIRVLASNSLGWNLFILIPVFFLIQISAPYLITAFFPEEFIVSSSLLRVLATMILIIPFGNVVGVQVLIPLKKELTVSLAPLLGLVTNFVICIILLPSYGIMVAAIAAVLGELMGSMFVTLKFYKMIDLTYVWKVNYKMLIVSSFTFLGIKNIENTLSSENPLFSLLTIGFVFSIITIFILFILKDNNTLRLVKNLIK